MMILADVDSLQRMLGVPQERFPAAMVAEYGLRLRMFHSDGNSGPLGTVALIDLLRSMKLGPKPKSDPPTQIDWSRVPADGSIHVELKRISKETKKIEWVSGVFVGQVGAGTLAVRLDGDSWVYEAPRFDVRLARERPPEPVVRPVEDVWLSSKADGAKDLEAGENVMVDDGDDYKDGVFKGRDDKGILVLVKGEKEPRVFDEAHVKRLDEPAMAR